MNLRTRIAVAALIAAATLPATFAADTFYLGTWKIAAAAVAPWADKNYKPDSNEMKTLMGKTVTIAAKGIQGPRTFVCNGAKYEIKEYSPDMVFQGAFGEMHERNKSADPAQLAATVGFKGPRIKTLETGCELDYHFIDNTTATVALNNYVYTIKKQ